jgi:hypothetical protein
MLHKRCAVHIHDCCVVVGEATMIDVRNCRPAREPSARSADWIMSSRLMYSTIFFAGSTFAILLCHYDQSPNSCTLSKVFKFANIEIDAL